MKFWKRIFSDRIFAGLILATVIRGMAASAILLFLPVYLFELGGLGLVIGWITITRLLDVVLTKPAGIIIQKIGYKKAIFWGELLWTATLICVVFARENLMWLIPAAILMPVAALGYWIPNHLLFSQTAAEKFGRDAGLLTVAGKWSGAAGPIIAGILTVVWGWPAVWGWCALMMILAIVPLWKLCPNGLTWDFHLDGFWKKITGKWFGRDLLAYTGLGMQEAMYEWFWPVFLFEKLTGSYLKLGGYKTAVLMVTTVIIILVGRKADKGGVRKWMYLGTIILAGIWILRGWVVSPAVLLGADILDGWVGILVFLPFSVYTYRRAMAADKPLYLLERETALRGGWALAAVLVGICYLMGWGWGVMAGIGIVGLGLMLLLPKISPEKQ